MQLVAVQPVTLCVLNKINSIKNSEIDFWWKKLTVVLIVITLQ